MRRSAVILAVGWCACAHDELTIQLENATGATPARLAVTVLDGEASRRVEYGVSDGGPWKFVVRYDGRSKLTVKVTATDAAKQVIGYANDAFALAGDATHTMVLRSEWVVAEGGADASSVAADAEGNLAVAWNTATGGQWRRYPVGEAGTDAAALTTAHLCKDPHISMGGGQTLVACLSNNVGLGVQRLVFDSKGALVQTSELPREVDYQTTPSAPVTARLVNGSDVGCWWQPSQTWTGCAVAKPGLNADKVRVENPANMPSPPTVTALATAHRYVVAWTVTSIGLRYLPMEHNVPLTVDKKPVALAAGATHRNPAVAGTANGFIVVWHDSNVLKAAWVRNDWSASTPFQLATGVDISEPPVVAVARDDGRAMVAWRGSDQKLYWSQIASGASSGSAPVLVSPEGTGRQPSLAALGASDFALSWTAVLGEASELRVRLFRK